MRRPSPASHRSSVERRKSRYHSHVRRALYVLATLSFSCFSPTLPTGKPCAQPGDQCPPGLDCIDGTCETPGTVKDRDPDVPDCPWRSEHLVPCAFPQSSAELLLDSDHVFDTDALTFETFVPDPDVTISTIEIGGVEAALIVADEIRLTPSASLRLFGTRPVIFAAYSSIKVEGTVDVSSTTNSRGAGGSPENCATDSVGLARGGAGGSHSTVLGGNGGGTNGGGLGGEAMLPTSELPLQGGCRGGRGGDGEPSSSGGSGGHGGGAIYLSAQTLIEISGTIAAGGGGGAGAGSGADAGSSHPGGGGGGAGGHVILESPQIMLLQALIAANGGGGGGGSAEGNAGSTGGPGPAGVVGGSPGQGGGAGGDGGRGGDGSGCPGSAAAPGAQTNGGGGGGGACGKLDIYSDDVDQSTSTFSPGPTTFELPE